MSLWAALLNVPKPATNVGGKMTKADIYKKDDKGNYILDGIQRQEALSKLEEE